MNTTSLTISIKRDHLVRATRIFVEVILIVFFCFAYNCVYSLSLTAFLYGRIIDYVLLTVAIAGSIILAYILAKFRLNRIWFITLLAILIVGSILKLGYKEILTKPQALSILTPPILTTIAVVVIYYRTVKRT